MSKKALPTISGTNVMNVWEAINVKVRSRKVSINADIAGVIEKG